MSVLVLVSTCNNVFTMRNFQANAAVRESFAKASRPHVHPVLNKGIPNLSHSHACAGADTVS